MSETTEVNRAAFGQFLNQLRREKGWTQKDLAERLYVSDKAVSKWERGLSLPDVALLLPLAGALGVSVTELLEGRRAVQEQRYSAAEVEALIRRALAFPVEPPERQQARVKRYLPVYLICCVLGVAEALAVWMLGLAPTEMGQTCLVLGVGFGVVYGAYAFFWMTETLPRYYDENRIAQFAQGGHAHPHPGRLLQQPQLAVCAAGLPGLVHGIHAAAATLSGGGGAAGPALGRQGDRCSICSVHPEPVRMHRRARQAA